MTAALFHQEYLQTIAPDGHAAIGYDQEWYGLLWRRRAGCGPTTAANMLTYLHRAGQLILPDVADPSMPEGLMDLCWNYITPTMWGLNTTGLFRDGADRLLASIGSLLRSQVLDVDKDERLRPTAGETAVFIEKGLAANSPVAFLNLSNGAVEHLDAWHWVTVLGLERQGANVVLRLLDNTNILSVDLALWLRTTTRGGGFVYLALPGEAESTS